MPEISPADTETPLLTPDPSEVPPLRVYKCTTKVAIARSLSLGRYR